MQKKIGIYEARTHFSELINNVGHGQTYIVLRSGIPQAKIVPIKKPKARRRLGSARGEFKVPQSFFDPLPDSVIDTFYQ